MLHNDLVKIKNAYMARHKEVEIPYSRLTHALLGVLKERQYVGNVKKIAKKPFSVLAVELLYTGNVPHVHEVRFFSKPGRKIYIRSSRMKRVRQGYGDMIVSTSQGIMTAKEARKKKLGGELLCEVF